MSDPPTGNWVKVSEETAALYAAAAKMAAPGFQTVGDLQSAYETFVKALTGVGVPTQLRLIARWTLLRIGAYELAEKLCDFKSFGDWAVGSQDPYFMQQFPRVRSREDRLELLEQHQRWAAWLSGSTAQTPLTPRAARTPGKLRLGLVSSSLYNHAVGQFALPVFERRDDRFDLHAYSFGPGIDDGVRRHMIAQSKFHDLTGFSPTDAAGVIAADDLDMLVELDGITGEHVLRIMAHRPARRQASWLGYPHSTGLSTIDYIVLDPHLQTDLVLERPILMPDSWVSLPRYKYSDMLTIDPVLPEVRNGHLTFGTLNNSYKYTLDSLATWARIVAACPGSKFLFGRPEAAAPSFRRGMIRRFAAQGVDEDRLIFVTDVGRHMAIYDQIDISLDTYPITGGTTTSDALWMGVPVVSLVGEGISERLSYSMLVNAGLSDLAAGSVEEYEAIALRLAGDAERRRELRYGLRERLRSGPLGQPRAFAEAFYDLMEATIRDNPA